MDSVPSFFSFRANTKYLKWPQKRSPRVDEAMLCFNIDSGVMQLELGEVPWGSSKEFKDMSLEWQNYVELSLWYARFYLARIFFFIIHKIIAHPTIDSIFDVDEIL